MAAFVVQHGVSNVWCDPNQDVRVTVAPVRISPNGGFLNSARVLWELIQLPTTGDFYAVYQIGQVPPVLYNLPNTKRVWMNAGSLIGSQTMMVRAYNTKGGFYPVGEIWFRINDDQNLIMAVRILRNYPVNLDTDNLWINLYSNAYFSSPRWSAAKTTASKPSAPGMQYLYATIGSSGDISSFHAAVLAAIGNTVGNALNVTYVKNGRFYSDVFTGTPLAVGDKVEAFIDASIRAIRYQPLTNCPSFNSTIDANTVKRLFPPSAEIDNDTIYYRDDLDFLIVSSVTSPVYTGLYFPQNTDSAVRMVTHNSYSLSDTQIQGQLATDTVFHTDADIGIAIVVRESGFLRSLMPGVQLLDQMYKMSDANIAGAMAGVNATLNGWTAAVLENGPYAALMSAATIDGVTEALVESAYGYNVMSKLFSYPYPTLTNVAGSLQFPQLIGTPLAAITTYDSSGNMLTIANGTNGSTQSVPGDNSVVSRVELTPGVITDSGTTNRYWGLPRVVFPTDMRLSNYRCYVCPIDTGNVISNRWIDVTANTDNYFTLSSDGKTITWDMTALGNAQYYPVVIVGGEILCYQVPLPSSGYPGYISFQINAKRWYVPPGTTDVNAVPTLETAPLTIPLGTLDLFMDGKSLIEGIDFVCTWPQVVITKRPTDTPSTGLAVWVRGYGFPNTDMTREGPAETGYVVDGVLSLDGRYNVRNDRNYRLIVGGMALDPGAVNYAEDDPSSNTGSALNGLPYAVVDIVMPVDNYTNQETYGYRAAAKSFEAAAGNYLTGKVATTPPPSTNPMPQLYDLVSPFCAAIIQNLTNGWLNGDLTPGSYDNTNVSTWVAPYTYLLAADPCLNRGLDMSYLYIRPHQYDAPVTLTSDQYGFLEGVIRDYLSIPGQPARLNLSAYVLVSG